MREYPTEQDILNAPVEFRKETIEAVHAWKSTNYKGWKGKDTEQKKNAIGSLIRDLAIVYKDKIPIPYIKESEFSRCEKHADGMSTIYLDPTKISIVTAMHEFAHHLYGESEFKACRWSVWLFKTCFPLEYKTLYFRGHLLVKRV